MYVVGDIVEWVGDPPDVGIVVSVDTWAFEVRWAAEKDSISHAMSTHRVRKVTGSSAKLRKGP